MTKPHGPPYSDEELQRWFDGELEEPRRGEVGAQIEDDAAAQAKLEGLRLIGTVLREAVDGDDRADGIADAVLAQLAVAQQEGQTPPEDDSAKVIPLPAPKTPDTTKPANDNARSIFAIAAVAAAVAAGLWIWGRAGEDEFVARRPPRVPPAAVAAASEPSSLPTPAWPAAKPGAEEEEEDTGVEVASVDFGSHSGSVFYVSAGAEGDPTTAVVWVADDATGEGP